jgi:cation diffusion facilitator family transporter
MGEQSVTAFEDAAKEKARVAFTSVLAAVLLTVMKLVVGIATGSLGILAEAAHSGLDLVAALVTFVAVRISDRPADESHLYGHGKVENLSALVEAVLLLITCAWIIYEAINRLFLKSVEIDANIWAIGVMVISILVDVGRSRALSRVAKKHSSQALEADALHFSTDIWSSGVVIVGLALVRLNEWLGGSPELDKADALAALGVAAIVIYVSLQLGKRTIDALLDRAPERLPQTIADEVTKIEGVVDCPRVRVREAGPLTFMDLTVCVSRASSLQEAHAVSGVVEERVAELVPRADVVVHVQPVQDHAQETTTDEIRIIAGQRGLRVHHVQFLQVHGRLSVELHVEVTRDLSVTEAHRRIAALEADILTGLSEISRVDSHIEPEHPHVDTAETVAEDGELVEAVTRIASEIDGILDCHDVAVRRVGRVATLRLHCSVERTLSIAEAHWLTGELERKLTAALGGIDRVLVHVDPA